MPAGILVVNNHGTVLIDDTYSNLAVSSASSGGVLAIGDGQLFRFDVPVPSGADYGLQIFNASGQCTFDSNLKYARVVDTFAGPTSQAGTVVQNYESGREYAVITSKRAAEMEREVRADPAPGFWNYRSRINICQPSVSGNTVTVAWAIGSWADWSPPIQVVPPVPTPDMQSRFIVLDVTGY